MTGSKNIGVVLSGGGARGAYQAGALKGVCEIAERLGIQSPFSIFSGISVGAINSAVFASYAENSQNACQKLVDIWSRLHTKDVIQTRALDLGKLASRMILELASGNIIKHKKARALLDNSPLSDLIQNEVKFSKIKKNIHEGFLKSLVVTAVNYSDGNNYIFFQTKDKIEPWIRIRRVVKEAIITKDHILASAALPLYFPPQKIGRDYYADGNVRNSTPLSPPIRLGAEKLLIITVKEEDVVKEPQQVASLPSLGRMVSVLLNALLLDAVDFDFERLSRINETLKWVPKTAETELKKIDVCFIRPKENIATISEEMLDEMPKPLRHLLEGLGSTKETEGLISTLLFEPAYTKELIQLGYEDALAKEEDLIDFLTR